MIIYLIKGFILYQIKVNKIVFKQFAFGKEMLLQYVAEFVSYDC